MRMFSGLAGLLLLAACGDASRSAADLPQVAAPDVSVVETEPTAPESPPAAEIVPYVHQPMIGRLGAQLDPTNLEPLAARAMVCGSGVYPIEYFNEPAAMQLGRASRNGNELRVGGQTRVDFGPIVVDGVAATHDNAFHYIGVLKHLDLDVVYVSQPEDEAYEIIDPSTSTIALVDGLPVASPSGRFLVAFGLDAMNFAGIQIIERSDAGLKLVKTFDTVTYACGLEWLSDTKATFQGLKPGGSVASNHGWQEEKRNYGPASIELRNGQWVFAPASD